MNDRPLTCTRWLVTDRPEDQRPHATPADSGGELDWNKATRLAWRPAWAIRSRRGAWSAFREMWRTHRKKD